MPHSKKKWNRSASTSKSCSSPKRKFNLIESYGLDEDDVAAYLVSVKVAFKDDKEKFIKFIKLLKDYKAQEITADDLVKEAKILFHRHPDLLLAFHTFLPETKTVAVNFHLQPLEKKCLDFIIKLKDFSPDLQKKFLNIMTKYGSGAISHAKLINAVTTLLKNFEDLLSEFKEFIPIPGENKEEDLKIVGPRMLKQNVCNFPELVFNKEILFFEKAKATLQGKKKAFEHLVTLLEKYLDGTISSCELIEEAENLYPGLDKDVAAVFVHEHPSYFMLSKKQKLQEQEQHEIFLKLLEERFKHKIEVDKKQPDPKKYKPLVMNNYCRLFRYDLSEASTQVKQEGIQEHSQAQKHTKKNRDIDSSLERYCTEMNRNKRTLAAIRCLLVEIDAGEPHPGFSSLLEDFNKITITNLCDEQKIKLLQENDERVLPIIIKDIEERQRVLKEQIELGLEKRMDSTKAQAKRVKKQY